MNFSKDDIGDIIGEKFLHLYGDILPGTSIKSNLFSMNTFKTHLISAGITFVSVFLVTISLAISNTSFSFDKEALLSLAVSALIAGVRGVAKLIVEWYSA